MNTLSRVGTTPLSMLLTIPPPLGQDDLLCAAYYVTQAIHVPLKIA